MKNDKRLILLTLFCLVSAPLASYGKGDGERPPLLYLKDLENLTINQSLELKSKKFEVDAAREKREALPSNYIPKLTLDGTYRYLSEIPEIAIAPGRSIKFGDNKNYSIGPTLSITLFDFKTKSHLQSALDKTVSAKTYEQKNLQANYLFKTRFHYLNMVLLLERTNLISESLKVAKKQLNDVLAKKKFGAVSKLDLLTAQKEVHELESQFKEIEFNITTEQSELFKVTYSQKIKEANFDPGTIYKNAPAFQLENLTDLKNRFLKYQDAPIDAHLNSKVKSIKEQSDSLESQARSINNQKYPKINIFARTSYDYPNGPALEQFNQNTIGLTLSMPLFDGGEITHNANEKKFQAEALKHQAFNEERNVIESSELILKRITNLNEQNEIIKNKISETSQIADLVYKSYQEGRATFLEVERANVKSRESKLSLSSNQYQIILNLIQLAALVGEQNEI